MNRKGILLVDDEALALKYFSKLFGNRFAVYSATSAKEALKVLDAHQEEIGVIVTDQRMPESSGVELLKIVRNRYPNTVRILTTAYSELDTLIAAINTGAVHSFVSKPWELKELERTLTDALEHHERQVQNARWLGRKVSELKSELIEDRAYDVGVTAAKIGHYVHNALCPLTFLLDQLLDRSQDRTTYPPEFLKSVRAHIYDVAQTLKDLEEISVPAPPAEYQLLNLEEALDKTLAETEIIRDQKRLRIEKTTQGQIPQIRAVPSQIEKLFRFMIAEEIVSLPAGSVVRMSLAAHEVDRQVLGVNIEFEDFVPVPPQLCPKSLLQPFNLRGSNPREFGIFLVSCYFIARHHGGSLNVKLKEGQGLVFSFFLPCESEEAASANNETLGSFPSKPRRSAVRR